LTTIKKQQKQTNQKTKIMKHKVTFGLQVFTTLILFLAIFVTYLERSDVIKENESARTGQFKSEIANKGDLTGFFSSSFITTLTGIISCGK
jgi:hypothetical protein